MLNKKFNEQEVRQLFASFGSIEECTVLRDQNGQSKGCAFVTYTAKQNAMAAIKVSVHICVWNTQLFCLSKFNFTLTQKQVNRM